VHSKNSSTPLVTTNDSLPLHRQEVSTSIGAQEEKTVAICSKVTRRSLLEFIRNNLFVSKGINFTR
jgi:hypothetical protein